MASAGICTGLHCPGCGRIASDLLCTRISALLRCVSAGTALWDCGAGGRAGGIRVLQLFRPPCSVHPRCGRFSCRRFHDRKFIGGQQAEFFSRAGAAVSGGLLLPAPGHGRCASVPADACIAVGRCWTFEIMPDLKCALSDRCNRSKSSHHAVFTTYTSKIHGRLGDSPVYKGKCFCYNTPVSSYGLFHRGYFYFWR